MHKRETFLFKCQVKSSYNLGLAASQRFFFKIGTKSVSKIMRHNAMQCNDVVRAATATQGLFNSNITSCMQSFWVIHFRFDDKTSIFSLNQ